MKKIILMFCFFASLAINAQVNTFDDSKVNGATGAGANDQTWETATNWSLGVVPTAAHDVVIAEGKLAKIKSTGAVANSITANGTAKVQINAEKDLTVTTDLTYGTNNNIFFVTSTGKNMGTLIFGGTASNSNTSAKIRLPANNKWHLISAPFKQARIDNFIADGTTILTNGTKYSMATYNDGNATGAKYTYFTTAIDGQTDKMEKGQGYSLSLNNTADPTQPDMQFKGKFNEGDVFSPTLVHAGNGFVLLGNPFTAYVYANENADATKNLLTVNSGKLEENTIWLWDGANEAWITKNQSDAAFHIAPGQGYFVKVKSDVTGAFRTNNDMQTHLGTDKFLKTSSNRFEIGLNISSNKLKAKTSIRFVDNKTTGFDNGYDSSMFDGYGADFAVYTKLVDNSNVNKLAIQSLPNSEFENTVIPVGVNAEVDSEITFSANVLNLPTGYKVYLEDRLNNTITRIDELNSEYKTKVSTSNTDGRFFLHAKTSSVLSTETDILNSVNIFKVNNTNLKITGLQQGKAAVSLFTILGKNVMNSTFEASNSNTISLPSLATGVYIVKLETEKGNLNKKIIIE